MNANFWIAALAVLVTFSTFLATVIFKMGGIAARVEALEAWRVSVRNDMHEISDTLTNISVELKALLTIIEERTERRGPRNLNIAPDEDARRPDYRPERPDHRR